jgi:hypothetical protein
MCSVTLVPEAAGQLAGRASRGLGLTDPAGRAAFTFDQPASDRLTLNGQLNGRPVTIALQQVDLNQYPLHSREFHWVQEYPNFR